MTTTNESTVIDATDTQPSEQTGDRHMSARVAHSLLELLEHLDGLRDNVESAAWNIHSTLESAEKSSMDSTSKSSVAAAFNSLNHARTKLWRIRETILGACVALDRPGPILPLDAELYRYLEEVAELRPTR